MKAKVQEKLNLLPNEPGCYLMKNKFEEVIYVGKAKNLKSRVSSYFTGAHDLKTTQLVRNIADFEFIMTSTEKESLILEINLIKKYRPRYNIIFMDDKSYPYLKLNRKGMPYVEISRDRKQDPDYYYFGPYPDATAARNMARVLNDSLPEKGRFRANTKAIYSKFNREEIEFSEEEVERWRQDLFLILRGQVEDVLEDLQKQMYAASEELNFELAQVLKDKIEAVEHISDKQKVQFPEYEEFDMFHYAYYQGYIAIIAFFVRSGRLIERDMTVEACVEEPEQALLSFMAQFYENQPEAKKIYVPQEIDLELAEDLFDSEVVHAYRGKKRHLLELAEKNAQKRLEDQFYLVRKRQSFKEEALSELADLLKIPIPERIEIFDISHLSGSFTVASCVVFDAGEANKDAYRRYRLEDKQDDTASMQEVLYRRYFRLLSEGKALPDLVILDGGKAQLSAAKEIFDSLHLELNYCSLVKDDRHRTRALMNDVGEEIPVDPHSSLFGFLVQMQDEVHRFAINYHRRLRSKAMTRSILDEVPGIGEVRKKALYREFRSLKRMREASVEELSAVVPENVAKELHLFLHIDWSEEDEEN